jgi:EmrB/QacA subfamily drug resistance transporter
MLASFLAAIEVTVVSTAMPRIVSDLGGIQLISWVFAVYLLTTSVGTPIFGKLADLFGRKAIMTVGMALFLVGSTLCGLAQSMGTLIAFRALQGLGAGAVLPVAITIVGDLYELKERGRVQGILSSIWGVAGIFGPLVGGLLVDGLSWHWIFFVNLPFGIIAIGMIWLFLHEDFEKRPHRIDYFGALTFALGISSLLLALLTGGQQFAWRSPVILLLFAAFALFMTLFVFIQRVVPEPIFPVEILTMREISLSNAGTLLLGAVLIGCNAYLPMWIQGVFGMKATSSGLSLIPMSIAWPVGATICARILVKANPRITALFGVICVLAGSLWLVTIGRTTAVWTMVPLMILTGLGFGFAFTVFTITVQTSVPWRLRGAATASNAFVRSLGQTLGIAVFGASLNASMADAGRSAGLGSAFNIGELSRVLNPQVGSAPAPGIEEKLREVLAAGLHGVFFLFVLIAAAGVVLAVLLPSRRLSDFGAASQ